VIVQLMILGFSMKNSVQSIIQVVLGNDIRKNLGICFLAWADDGNFNNGVKTKSIKLIHIVKVCETLEWDMLNRSDKTKVSKDNLNLTIVSTNSCKRDNFLLGTVFFSCLDLHGMELDHMLLDMSSI